VTTALLTTRERLVLEAARLFAARGFHGTSVEEVGSACGISGPAVYKHFSSKVELLGEILTGISDHLLEGGRAVVEASPDPAAALRGLVAFHVDFALARPDLIRVQDRDLSSLREDDRRRVRRLQRAYVELWGDVLVSADAHLTPERARTRAHAVFGLLNSTPHSARTGAGAREELTAMAVRALG
jgi:AcrR family transcriptional regulator